MAPAARAERRASKASASLLSSPNATTVAGRSSREQRVEGFALAAGRPRPHVHDEPAAVVGEVVRRDLGIRGLDGRRRPPPARRPGPAAWRTWNATDGPLRSTNSQSGRSRSSGTRVARRSAGAWAAAWSPRYVVTIDCRAPAARVRPVLEPVVAEVADAADPDARGDVGGGPTGQDGDGDTLRPACGDPGQPAQGALGGWHDDRRARVARADGQRPVEVGDDEERPGRAIETRPDRWRPGSRRDVDPGRSIVLPPTWTGRGLVRAGRRGGRHAALGRTRRWRRAWACRGRRRRRGQRDGDGTGEATMTALGATVAIGDAVGCGTGSGASATIPPRTRAATTTPTRRPAGIDSRDIVGRRVPVPAAGGVPERPLLRCGSHGRPRGSLPHPDHPGTPDRHRRDPPCRRAAVVHEPGHRGSAAERHARSPRSQRSSRHRARSSPCRRSAPVARRPPSPTIPADRVATRIRIAALGIDLPIVKPQKDPTAYPYCNVAMYLPVLGQPGEGHATYLYAHAREGHVPAAPQLVARPERQEDAGHGRRGLDQRRPALPVRDHRGPPPHARTSTTRSTPRARSSGSRRPKGRTGTKPQAPGPRHAAVRRSRPTRPTHTPRRIRSSAARTTGRIRGAGRRSRSSRSGAG